MYSSLIFMKFLKKKNASIILLVVFFVYTYTHVRHSDTKSKY